MPKCVGFRGHSGSTLPMRGIDLDHAHLNPFERFLLSDPPNNVKCSVSAGTKPKYHSFHLLGSAIGPQPSRHSPLSSLARSGGLWMRTCGWDTGVADARGRPRGSTLRAGCAPHPNNSLRNSPLKRGKIWRVISSPCVRTLATVGSP